MMISEFEDNRESAPFHSLITSGYAEPIIMGWVCRSFTGSLVNNTATTDYALRAWKESAFFAEKEKEVEKHYIIYSNDQSKIIIKTGKEDKFHDMPFNRQHI